MPRIALVLALAVLSACSAQAPPGPRRANPPPASPPVASATPQPERAHPNVAAPAPNAPIPLDPSELANTIRDLDRRMRRDIVRWTTSDSRLDTPAADAIELQGLYHQRVSRLLAKRPGLARKVLPRLPRRLAAFLRANIAAANELSGLVTPTRRPPRFRYASPAPPGRLLDFYRAAEKRFGIPWHVLAAVNFVESKFGRVLGPSSAGALGPMQFLPSTWEVYGRGDILDPRDSIMGAARYLAASGAPEDMRGALFAYNRSDAYVNAILIYADQIRRDELSFYAYYFWQVFVRTTRGDVQLTGPGAERR